jgi:hypothetical protein
MHCVPEPGCFQELLLTMVFMEEHLLQQPSDYLWHGISRRLNVYKESEEAGLLLNYIPRKDPFLECEPTLQAAFADPIEEEKWIRARMTRLHQNSQTYENAIKRYTGGVRQSFDNYWWRKNQ